MPWLQHSSPCSDTYKLRGAISLEVRESFFIAARCPDARTYTHGHTQTHMQVHIPTKIHKQLQREDGADLRPCPLKSDIHSGISFLFIWLFVYDMENVIICLFMETVTFGRG